MLAANQVECKTFWKKQNHKSITCNHRSQKNTIYFAFIRRR